MSLVAELEFETDVLKQATEANPDVDLYVEDALLTEDVEVKIIYWAHGTNLDYFEENVDSDPTVSGHDELSGTGSDKRLYSTTLVNGSELTAGYQKFVDEDIVLMDVSARAGRVDMRLRLDNRDTLSEILRWVNDEKGMEVSLCRLYEDDGDGIVNKRWTVTQKQQEAMQLAREQGYYDEPRTVSLSELGVMLGISQGAVGGRLRRGTGTLIDDTVGESEDE